MRIFRLYLWFNLFVPYIVLAVYDPDGLEIDLRSSHGLLNSSAPISQEALKRIISGAESGNKG